MLTDTSYFFYFQGLIYVASHRKLQIYLSHVRLVRSCRNARNLKREDSFKNSKKYKSIEDVINKVCEDHILYLSPKYNFMTFYQDSMIEKIYVEEGDYVKVYIEPYKL